MLQQSHPQAPGPDRHSNGDRPGRSPPGHGLGAGQRFEARSRSGRSSPPVSNTVVDRRRVATAAEAFVAGILDPIRVVHRLERSSGASSMPRRRPRRSSWPRSPGQLCCATSSWVRDVSTKERGSGRGRPLRRSSRGLSALGCRPAPAPTARTQRRRWHVHRQQVFGLDDIVVMGRGLGCEHTGLGIACREMAQHQAAHPGLGRPGARPGLRSGVGSRRPGLAVFFEVGRLQAPPDRFAVGQDGSAPWQGAGCPSRRPSTDPVGARPPRRARPVRSGHRPGHRQGAGRRSDRPGRARPARSGTSRIPSGSLSR